MNEWKKNLYLFVLLAAKVIHVFGRSTTLFPHQIISEKGEHNREELEILSKNESSGDTDDWVNPNQIDSTYIELTPNRKRYEGIAYFNVPFNFRGTEVIEFDLIIKIRGLAANNQKWKFQLIRHINQATELLDIGDNEAISNWEWKTVTAVTNLPDKIDLLNFMDGNGDIMIKIISSNNEDSLNIDYMSLRIMVLDTPQKNLRVALPKSGAIKNNDRSSSKFS